ncbi:hypothetical protein OAT16_05295 [Prolixibacteraceae bacterium]|nr:hypothetical protein [Prolixibacteraceae bacterium]
MGKIKIDSALKVNVFVDGELVKTIPKGTTTINVADENHKVYAESGFLKTNEMSVSLDSNSIEKMSLTSFKGHKVIGILMILLSIISFFGAPKEQLLILMSIFIFAVALCTLGRKRYIKLKQG